MLLMQRSSRSYLKTFIIHKLNWKVAIANNLLEIIDKAAKQFYKCSSKYKNIQVTRKSYGADPSFAGMRIRSFIPTKHEPPFRYHQ